MLDLRTGVPRQGKTLHMVSLLAALLKRWEDHPEEVRPVFCHKIYDLTLKHSPVPLVPWKSDKVGTVVEVPDWEAMPDGSLVLIDECDKIFPPRSASVVAPDHVNWLTEHGHKGFDIWLTTQHPKFIDSKVRALCGKHLHFRRLFGMSRSVIYEWDSCNDGLTGFKTAVKTFWSFPSGSYKWYKSATIHTKQSFRLPLWLMIPFVGVALGLFFMPRAFSVIFNGVAGKPLVSKTPVSVLPGQDADKVELVHQSDSNIIGVGAASAVAGSGVPVFGTSPAGEGWRSADSVEVLKDRPVEALKIARGVYGDDPLQEAHYSAEQLENQRVSVRVLQHLDDQRAAINEYFAGKDDFIIPVTFNKPQRLGSYQ